MPVWRVHEEWCKRFGVDEEITREINRLIDCPKKWYQEKYPEVEIDEHRLTIFNAPRLIQLLKTDPCLGLAKLSKATSGLGHDIGRGRVWQMVALLECVFQEYGREGVQAAVLHHALDTIERYITTCETEDLDNVLEYFDKRFEKLLKKENYKNKEILEIANKTIREIRENIYEIIYDILYQLK